MKIDFKKLSRQIGYHSEILFKGFLKMVFGTATATLIALAIYGFLMIPKDNGYTAVGDFTLSMASLVLAMGCMYIMGGRGKAVKKGAKK